ncbi:hypothetical protein COHA_006906 [Chlorella ohadii]|uniref:peptidylprolyl isomerase n=1 Tax=Chlorella ohadii TaxID=2649997 RepID=A0AAD5DLY0_9CHLO|nr:hypothetical protein COHA_006906 [Chlorella ohadii]
MQALAPQRAALAAPVAARPAAQPAKAARGTAPRWAPQQQQSRRQQRLAAAPRRAVVAVAAPAGDVSVEEEKLMGAGVRLHVSVPAEQCQKAYNKLMKELREATTVQGFRKGKAPDAALIAHVGGVQRVYNSVLSEMLEPMVAKAMAPYEGVAVIESERIEQNAEELESRFSLESGFSFTIRFDAVPPLTWKTPYRELQVAVESTGDESGDAAQVEKQLLSLLKSKAKLKVVADRGLQQGDLAIVNFSAKRADTGEELPGATRNSMRLDTDDADTTFLPGIVAIMMDMKPGEEKVAPLRFPSDESFQPPMLRGVEATVTLKMTELFSYDLPELTDEFANSLLPGAGLAGLRDKLLEAQRFDREREQRERIADAFSAAVGRAVECDIPESLINELGAQQYQVELTRLLSSGRMDYNTVQQLATPELAAQFAQSRREELLELQRTLLGMEDIAVQEGLKPSEAEIESEFKAAASDFTKHGQEFDAARLREQVMETVQGNKVMDWLMANCKVTVLPARED